MPFGLKNTPTIFQWQMDNIFKKYNSFVIVHINDVLDFSNTLSEHISHLRIILHEFKTHGLVISEKKLTVIQR